MNAKQFKNHSDVPEEYTWDLEDILKGDSIENLIDKYHKVRKERILNKDKKYENIEAYLNDVKLSEQETILSFKIDNYISNHLNTDLVNAKFKKLEAEFQFLNHKLNTTFGSETNRFYANIEKMKLWMNDRRLASYRRQIQDEIDEYEHKLDDKVEEYIINSSFGFPSPHNTFSILSNSELDYGIVTSKTGKKIKLNPAIYSKLLKSNDEQVRKQAYHNYWNAFIKHKDTFAELLFQHFKSITTEAKLRKYTSAVAMLTSKDKVTDEILKKLFSKVSESKQILKKYKKWSDKFYQIKFKSRRQLWDYSRDLVSVKTSYTVSEMNELAKTALKPFGQEYHQQVCKAIDEKWVDYMSTDTKRGGAYSIGGTYGIDKKYILMNFEGTLASVETLVHELGHSMHSYFSDTRQDLQNSMYPIFLAEIASIYNEFMLADYMLKTSTDKKLKFEILNSMIQGFIGTVLKQTSWANYEYDLYNAIANGSVSGSFDSISKLYYTNSQKYTLVPQKYSVQTSIQSIYVPHYYYGFYVYKYAIGQLVATYFFRKYKTQGKTALDDYINNFLSAGGNDYPLNILKKVGVDLTTDKFYDNGLTFLKELVDEWLQLGKEIFKVK
ncbi:oligoendopeptidase F [Mycoplasmopsis mustelae]|uniref:Oligopeptidase F n=1 Tax=Mycoplasmopsis mustelae TaxID=171289 RepID=A0A4R7UC86_9BACT|nr:oligoendopeptidase F [Mycoplasmopsis mustelae]TDV23547.1 oligoendopeptidase F [Mycoplasmopsis mustelae]